MNSIELLAKLVSFPTLSTSSTTDLISFVAAFLKQQGAVVEILPDADGSRQNLWARLGPDVAGGIALSGHVDVVPVEGQPWSTDPFVLTEKDGKLFGRGTCDMKAFVACVLSLSEKLKDKKLIKPVYIGLTFDEEGHMTGVKELVPWLAKKQIKPDWFWLGEPTELQVISQHKGFRVYQVNIQGAASHASMPHLGLNAIQAAADICIWVRQRANEFAASPHANSLFDPPYTTLSVGQINGGKAANIVADTCELVFEYRLHPGDDGARIDLEFEAFLDQTVRPYLSKHPLGNIAVKKGLARVPFISTPNNPGEKLLCALTGTGKAHVASYLTEAPHLQELGIPVVICGPGSVLQAHRADEFVQMQEVYRCDELLMQCLQADHFFE